MRVPLGCARLILLLPLWSSDYVGLAMEGGQIGGYRCPWMHSHTAAAPQVLARDIRPVHRRLPSPLWADVLPPPASLYPGGTGHVIGQYHVVLEHIDVSYDIDSGGRIVLRGATPNTVHSQQRGLGLLEEGSGTDPSGTQSDLSMSGS